MNISRYRVSSQPQPTPARPPIKAVRSVTAVDSNLNEHAGITVLFNRLFVVQRPAIINAPLRSLHPPRPRSCTCLPPSLALTQYFRHCSSRGNFPISLYSQPAFLIPCRNCATLASMAPAPGTVSTRLLPNPVRDGFRGAVTSSVDGGVGASVLRNQRRA